MSAVMERERRATAGKRMTFLAGQELENDEAFWTHDTWQEDNESFHSSDAASSAEEDVFDSDFDESENEEDVVANEEMIGAAMEREIEQEERDHNNKKRSSAYMESSNKLGNKKKAFGTGGRRPGSGPIGKRVVGDGLNAGIVLNVPPQYQKNSFSLPSISPQTLTPQLNVQQQQPLALPSVTSQMESTASTNIHDPKLQSDLRIESTPATTSTTATVHSSPQKSVSWPDTTVSYPIHPASVKKEKKVSGPTLAATRIRRTSHENKMSSPNIRSRKSIKPSEKINTEKSPQSSNGLKRGKQSFTQEELLLEAVQVTEPENERWILGQKRNQDMKDDIETQIRNNQSSDKNTKLIEKFVSRRGYFNTITFPDMDHIPYVLQRRRSLSSTLDQQPNQKPLCIITGKVAKYRDPKTGHGYVDIEAFRELRRRYETNQLPTKVTGEIAEGNTELLNTGTPAVMDSTAVTISDKHTGSTRAKPQRRSKSTTKETGTKGKISTNKRITNRKSMKVSASSNDSDHAEPILKDGNKDEFMIEPRNKSSPSTRPRTTSTGGDSMNASINSFSKVYDYETISPSNHLYNHPINGNGHNDANNRSMPAIASLPLSPPLSPGRKSPRTPKPTVKILESTRAMIPSFLKQEPQLLSQNQLLNTVDLGATASTPFPAVQHASESVKH